MAEHQGFWSSWHERLTALRNTPPVLKIVWQSGPGVVISDWFPVSSPRCCRWSAVDSET